MKQSETKRRGASPAPIDARRAQELLNDGVAHHQAGKLEKAAAIYDQLLRATPNHPDALHLSGVVALQTGDAIKAVDLIGRAIVENGSVALYHRNMAAAHDALNQPDDALRHTIKTAELEPADGENHLRLATALDRAERPAEAAASYRRAIGLGPQDAETHTALAVALMTIGDEQEAGRNFALALDRAPDAAFSHANLGRFHAGRGDFDAAEPLLRRALDIDPDFHEALTELGALLNTAYRGAEALPVLEKARALRPDSLKARNEYAAALGLTGELDQAHDELQAIVEDNPDDYKAHNNLGLSLGRLDRFHEAMQAHGNAIRLKPDDAAAYTNRSLLRLALGDFAGGWRDYLYRDTLGELADSLRRDNLPTDLSGKRIALHRDQGLGDEIFFLRFAGALRERGARIAYNPDPKIAGMIERLDFIDDIVPGDWPAEDFDLRISLGDLPFLLSVTDADQLPPPLELAALPERDHDIATYLRGIGPPPYIGCTWRAGIQVRDKLSKMSPVSAMAELLASIDGTVVILQRNPRRDEIDILATILGRRLHDASRYNEDLEGMLALLGRINDYVCVSNTNTHLRAARGLTSRVLVPLPPDYRWMHAGDESPWFPGTPLYRETADTGWDDAYKNLSRDLSRAFSAR